MSAETLRRAAALMRERAESVPAGPWQAGERIVWNDVAVGPWHGSSIVADGDEGDAGCETPQIAEHIASWHPAVALAVADWLDMQAGWVANYGPNADSPWIKPHTQMALAVARAYLGESA